MLIPEKSYDYIFAGFGLSGMTLFHELSKQKDFAQKKVLILEPEQKIENDRTWSFWAADNHEYGHLAKKKWQKANFVDQKGITINLDLKDYSYFTIEGQTFYQFIHKQLAQWSNIEWRYEKIVNVLESGQVETDKACYNGNLVFRSYFQKSDFKPSMSKYFLWQHFYGYVIKTKSDVFDEKRFTIMDYGCSDKDLTNFFYILPFKSNEALVEFTEFSPNLYSEREYRAKLEDYISRKLQISDYEIQEVEYNAIPMTDFRLPKLVSSRLIQIGSLAGDIKPSSGYAFARTVANNKLLAEMIAKKLFDEKDLQSSSTYQGFDAAVLYLMQTQRLHGGLIFASLFRKLGGDFVFRFLDEKCGALELFRITLASPKKWQFVRFFILRFFGKA